MTRTTQLSAIAAACLLASACATHQTSRTASASTLALGAGSANTAAGSDGLTAMAWGDAWTATNLFEQANDEHSTVLSRFNLAAGYQRTGRLDDAARLYRALAVDGQYVWANSGSDNNDRSAVGRRFNIGEESARRLARIAPAMSRQMVRAHAAGDATVPPSATVSAPVGDAVTDRDARQRDAVVEAGR
jgi:hypothetical protein